VLVVDDDEGVRAAYRVILEDAYDVIAVPDGLSAIEIVSPTPSGPIRGCR